MARALRVSAVQRLARGLLSSFGWRVEVIPPPAPKCVIVVYPHTSNWDFVVGYVAKLAVGLPIAWIGKDTLFRWPVGKLFRRMGGIPVNRRSPAGFVRQLARELDGRDFLWLALAPEGTRAHTDRWKSGFYRLALEAKVPVGLAFIDWRTRTVGLSKYLSLTGDEAADLEQIRAAYAGRTGKHPENAGEISLSPGIRRGRGPG
jgi:1-acyl-sn-glycerol-3-phosphate acyltransferase